MQLWYGRDIPKIHASVTDIELVDGDHLHMRVEMPSFQAKSASRKI
jgi:hypothetical protein